MLIYLPLMYLYFLTGFSAFSIGANIKMLTDRPDGAYCFREHNNRVYYASEYLVKQAGNVNPDKLVSIGVCFGKFTKTGKFRLHITALHYIAPYAQVIYFISLVDINKFVLFVYLIDLYFVIMHNVLYSYL